MDFESIKNLLTEFSENPDLLDKEEDIIEGTIHDIIRAEKKYSFGLDMTTQHDRQNEIERIILTAIEKMNNEN